MSKKMRKLIVSISALSLVMVVAIGTTIAYLTASTGSVVNTFTVGNIQITLQEHDYDPDSNQLNTTIVDKNEDYKIIPGVNLPKDPYITIKANSEPCWLFVKIEESENWPDTMTYSTATGWNALENESGVYYREVTSFIAADTDYPILEGNQVVVADTITAGSITGKPTLTFTAYACQRASVDTAAAAWGHLNGN